MKSDDSKTDELEMRRKQMEKKICKIGEKKKKNDKPRSLSHRWPV